MKIDYNSCYFPEKLRSIKNPPKKLYVLGNVEILNNLGIAIVGSRSCTTYGEKMAKIFTKKLTKYNINIISGLAIGIDKYAHQTTIENQGKTIAVLPSGFNNIYPKEHKYLIDKILETGGAVISEYEPETKVQSKNFLKRNRIVSGLSDGILIIEGGYRSGTSVTAKIAKQQEKKVFCIPSSLENPKGLIPNTLIHDGAILVRDEQDIINCYENVELRASQKDDPLGDEFIKDELSKNIKSGFCNLLVYQLLENEMEINEIVKKSKLKIEEVNYQLLLLELNNEIEQLPGKRYRRKINV